MIVEQKDIVPALADKPNACRYLGGISERKLEYLVAEKKLKPVRIGRRVFFRYADLAKFIGR